MKKQKKATEPSSHEIYIRKLFANNLRKERNDRNMSQKDLSYAANLSINFINDIENEKKSPSIKTMAKLMEAFDIEPFRFLIPDNTEKIDDVIILKKDILNFVNERIERYTNYTLIKPEPSLLRGGIAAETVSINKPNDDKLPLS